MSAPEFDEQEFLVLLRDVTERWLHAERVSTENMNRLLIRTKYLVQALIATRMQLLQARREAGTPPLPFTTTNKTQSLPSHEKESPGQESH